MQTEEQPAVRAPSTCICAMIVSEVRFLRESLMETLTRYPEIDLCAESASEQEALTAAKALQPAIALLDVAFPGGLAAVAKIVALSPATRVVALAIIETEANVLAWAAAGAAGYVPNTASVDELVDLLRQISRGEQTCSPRVSGSLLRRIATAGQGSSFAGPQTPLTRREAEVFALIGGGLSNKDIARRLRISVGTTKSHVHNLLAKLNLQRRSEATRLHMAQHRG